MHLSDQRRPCISLDIVHDIFPAAAGQQMSCQLCCVPAWTRNETQARQDQPRAWEDEWAWQLSSTLPATEIREKPRLLPDSARSPFCLHERIMLAFLHSCGRHLADQQSRIKLCSLLCKVHPPYLMTSAWMLSGPAALLSLRLRMAFSTSSKDGGSSSFGMIGSVGGSSRKPGSVVWTLFSMLCKYSAHLSWINSLFLIKTPSVLLTGCKERRLGRRHLLVLHKSSLYH